MADVNGDGRPDLVTVSNHDSATGVLLGNGDGTFQPVTAASGVGLSDTPFLADFNGDGIPDSVVLDRSGNILFRKGLAGATNAFAPPVILNPGRPARDITILRIGSQFAIAAADAHYRPHAVDQSIRLHRLDLHGRAPDRRTVIVAPQPAFSTTALPTSLAAADLTGNGLDDLIAANALDNSVTIALQTSPGQFAAPITVPTGIAPSDIAVADVNGDGLPDIVVSDQASGDVTVLLNDPAHSFSKSLRFRASTGPVRPGHDLRQLRSSVRSRNRSAWSRATSPATGRNDLVVVNQATHSFTVLAADGNGGFANPQLGLTTSTSDGLSINERPGAIVAGDFNRDGRLDLAVLMEDTGQLWIYSGNGDGTFRHTFSIPVGDEATGLSVVPGSGNGLLNLLVGNGFGDVLTLEARATGPSRSRAVAFRCPSCPICSVPGRPACWSVTSRTTASPSRLRRPAADQYTPVQTLGSASLVGADGAGRRPVGCSRRAGDLARRRGREHRQQRRGGLSHHGRQTGRPPSLPRRRPTSSAPPRPASPWPTSTATAFRTC